MPEGHSRGYCRSREHLWILSLVCRIVLRLRTGVQLILFPAAAAKPFDIPAGTGPTPSVER